MATSSLKEYLKKSTGNNEEEKKKKKKREPKYSAEGVLIVDEDPVWQKPVDLKNEEDSTDEEKPKVEDIEVNHMKRLEQLKMRWPFGCISEDGNCWVSVTDNCKHVNYDQNFESSPAHKIRADYDTPPKPNLKESGAADANLSPPRDHRKSYQLDDQNSDISPPRKRRARYDSSSPKPEQKPSTAVDVDLSPPRQHHKRYHSPSPQPQTKIQSSGGRRARYDTPSPEHHFKASESTGDITDFSPPRRQRTGDISPPRKGKKDKSISNDVSARKSRRSFEDDASDFAYQISDLSPPRKRRKGSPYLTQEPKTGLVSGLDIKEEITKNKKSDWLRYKEMDPSVSGRDAEPVYRDRETGERMSKDEFLKSQKKAQKKEEKPKEIKLDWGKGLAQKREAEARLQELEAEKDKPFARNRMEYHLDNVMRALSGKVTSNCNFSSYATVLEGLNEEHINILHRSFLWSFYSLKDMQFSGRIIDSLLLRLLKPVDGDALYFAMGDGKVSRVSILEFVLITGLKCNGEELARARIIANKRLLNLYFGGKGSVTLPQLEDAFRKCDHMLDKLKLGLVFILESVLRCRHRKASIDLFSLDVVDDIDAFNSFPWGRRCYIDTLHVFRRVHSMPKSEKAERKYDAYGFPLALQIWAYEAIPALGSRWAIRKETSCPRMLHWRAHEKPLAKDLASFLDDPQLEVHAELTASMDEEDQMYMRELCVPPTEDNPLFESIPDRDRERHPVERRSPPLPVSPLPAPIRSPPPIISPSPAFRHLPRGSPARSRSVSIDDLFELLTTFVREMRGEVVELRHDVTMLRADLRDLHTEVVAVRGDIAGLRETQLSGWSRRPMDRRFSR